MPAAVPGKPPSLQTFLQSLKQSKSVEQALELFISLLKRRQIRNPRACALGTAHLLLRVISTERTRNPQALIQRVRDVGRRLVAAQPRELAVGNIVRRVLGVIREIAEDSTGQGPGSSTLEAGLDRVMLPPAAAAAGNDAASEDSGAEESSAHDDDDDEEDEDAEDDDDDDDAATTTPENGSGAKSNFANQVPQSSGSLFGIFQHPTNSSGLRSPPSSALAASSRPTKSGGGATTKAKVDVKAEVIEGIKDLLDELEQVDTQIADFALDHIHSNEIILTHTSSQTVQRFLLTAAKKRKFTVIHAEAYPNDHLATHATIVSGGRKQQDSDDPFADASADDPRWKPLTALGIQVILIPDTAAFALMSRVSKVVLAPHAVLADGSLLAAAGAQPIAAAARVHAVPIVVLSGVYKLGPVYPFDPAELVEFGDPGKVVAFQEGISGGGEDVGDQVDVVNPVYDWVEAGLVDLYVTNLGAHAPSYLYRIVEDHYYRQDADLMEGV